VSFEFGERSLSLPADFLDDGAWLGVGGTGDDADAAFDDASFFACDQGETVAEDACMVETDACDDRQSGSADVGGVEASAEADFQDKQVDAAALEVEEGGGGGELEEGRGDAHRLNDGAQMREDDGQFVGADGFAIDLEAFLDARQVRRGKE